MHRNLDRRVEVLCQVSNPQARAHMREFMDAAFSPHTSAWDLQPDGTWVRSDGPDQVDLQELLMKRLADRGE
jgi:polyphosphate kinase